MKSIVKLTVVTLVTAMSVMSSASAALLEEHFNDLSRWTYVEAAPYGSQVSPYIDSLRFPDQTTKPYVYLPYRTMVTSLGQSISTFDVTWQWAHESHAATNIGCLMIVNEAGTQGYGVKWTSPTTGNDYMSINKWTSTAIPNRGSATINANFANLFTSSLYFAGNGAASPFDIFNLKLDNTGKLTLTVTTTAGVYTRSVTDTAFTSFSKIAIVGAVTTSALYTDELIVTPEPATLAILLIGCGLLRKTRLQS